MALIVLMLPCGFLCSMSLPHGALSWSVICNCGISRSKVKSGKLGQQAKFGHRTCLFHILYIRIKKLSKQ